MARGMTAFGAVAAAVYVSAPALALTHTQTNTHTANMRPASAMAAYDRATVNMPVRQQPGYTTNCGWSYSVPGAPAITASFDLSAMRLDSQTSLGYDIWDVRDSATEYIFNICGEIKPPITQPAGRCPNTTATAFQVQNYGSGDNCYRLGSSASVGWNFSIYDPNYPARGVMLTYPLGDGKWCPAGRPRTLTVELLCSKLVPNGPASYETATAKEVNTCDYHVQLPSIYGCPAQCLTGTGSSVAICSNNGVCGYNTDTKLSQCFCNTGFSGAFCGSRVVEPSGLSAEGVILIIVCIVLAGVLGLLGYMLLKLRRLQVDPAAYGQLTNKFNELGQLA